MPTNLSARGWQAGLRQVLLALAVAVLPVALRAQTAPACPPTATAPTPEQMQAAQRAAQDRGFLWRAEKDGRVSWLYGTVHVGKLEWIFPGPRVREALAAADTVALELDLADPAIAAAVVRAITAGPAAPRLPAPLAARMAALERAACLPPGALDSQHPVMRAITLQVLETRWEGLDPGYAQELMLSGAARASGRPVVSMETVDTQMSALIPTDPATAIAMVEAAVGQIENGIARRMATRMATAWAEARLADVEDYERWCECVADEESRAFMRRLNDGRNPALADRIDALHREGRRVFAAVGSLHMTGAQALPRLMAQRGYRVERVEFMR